MRVKTSDLKNACSAISAGLSKNKGAMTAMMNKVVEISVSNKELLFKVTDGEYVVTQKISLNEDEVFSAVVDAANFVELISKLDSEDVELQSTSSYLAVKTTGTYKLAICEYDGKPIHIDDVLIGTVTATLDLPLDYLKLAYTHNSKELLRCPDLDKQPIQKKYYYFDNEGIITYTSGACISSFKLSTPVKFLLNDRTVKLFKLFKNVDSVHLEIGESVINGVNVQIARFTTPSTVISVKLPSAMITSKFAVANIRTLLSLQLPHKATVSKSELLGAIDRILFLNSVNSVTADNKAWGTLTFKDNRVVINDFGNECNDTIGFEGDPIGAEYKLGLYLNNFKSMVEGSADEKVDICFGNGRMVIVKKPSLTNIVEAMPESRATN